jgi:hypothetical protein
LSPTDATKEIRRILREGGELRLSREAQTDDADPRDAAHTVSLDEVHECLHNGHVNKKAAFDPRFGQYTYQVEYRYDVRSVITVVAILSRDNVLRIITRFKTPREYDRTRPKAKKVN